LVIGSVFAYYDIYKEGCEADTSYLSCLRAHPQFCHLGFKSGLQYERITEDGLSSGPIITIPYSNTASASDFSYTIDPVTLEVTVFNL